jgi:hypothetical protein
MVINCSSQVSCASAMALSASLCTDRRRCERGPIRTRGQGTCWRRSWLSRSTFWKRDSEAGERDRESKAGETEINLVTARSEASDLCTQLSDAALRVEPSLLERILQLRHHGPSMRGLLLCLLETYFQSLTLCGRLTVPCLSASQSGHRGEGRREGTPATLWPHVLSFGPSPQRVQLDAERSPSDSRASSGDGRRSLCLAAPLSETARPPAGAWTGCDSQRQSVPVSLEDFELKNESWIERRRLLMHQLPQERKGRLARGR